jgi:signal transduction histidine kinase
VDKLQETAVSFSNLVALEHWQPEVVDLGELTEHTLASLSVFRRRGIDVVTELPSDEECLIMGDRQWLRRALDNLVKNSVDALGGGGGEVCLRLACADDMVAVEVEDTAGGVPEGQLQDLFSPHFSTTSAGSGLGLALVHQVVTRCQGRVAAVNGERGLVVRMEFPRA